MRPAKTQISLGIRPGWSESSLSAWRKLGSLAIHWADSEDSDQPGHPSRLIRVFAVRMKKARVLSYPLSGQRRLWSDWADAQADLSLRVAHSHIVGFVMRRLICYSIHCREVHFVSHCLSKTIASLELIFVPCFAHTMHIMLPENCWPINSFLRKLSAWIWVDVGSLKFHPITKLRDLTSVLLGLLVHLSDHYLRITSIMNIKLIK